MTIQDEDKARVLASLIHLNILAKKASHRITFTVGNRFNRSTGDWNGLVITITGEENFSGQDVIMIEYYAAGLDLKTSFIIDSTKYYSRINLEPKPREVFKGRRTILENKGPVDSLKGLGRSNPLRTFVSKRDKKKKKEEKKNKKGDN